MVDTIAPKNNIDPITIHTPPMNSPAPVTGLSAIPAVENAAIPQYNAFPYVVIDDASDPVSLTKRAAEKSSQRASSRKIDFTKGVCIRTSLKNFSYRLARVRFFLFISTPDYLLEFSCRDPGNAEVSIICRSDFSRELSVFATKVAAANTCKSLCVLCASARVNFFVLFINTISTVLIRNHSRSLN